MRFVEGRVGRRRASATPSHRLRSDGVVRRVELLGRSREGGARESNVGAEGDRDPKRRSGCSIFSMGETIEPMRRTATEATVPRAAGVEDQLAAFFDAHYERMVGLAGLVCRSHVLAEDAVQAAMEQAWKRRSSLRDPNRMRWWLDRIVVREAIRMNRRPWWIRLTAKQTDEQASRLPDPAGETTPQRMALTTAFAALTAEQRAACMLHLHLGYGVVETAQLMGAGVETTRSRLRLARRRLRADLAEEAV